MAYEEWPGGVKVWMSHIYESIPSPQELSYKDFYTEMVHKFPSGSLMVEVGVYHGRSFSYLIIEMLNAGKKFDCVAVDACPWDGEPCTGFHRHMEPLKDHYRVMFEKVDSFVAAKNFEDGSIDMCFIDANHTYPFVIQDIKAYLPKMKKGGTISGHDMSDPGVKQAVEEIFGQNYTHDQKQDIWYVQL
jgi:cephalosporin hydroxylase